MILNPSRSEPGLARAKPATVSSSRSSNLTPLLTVIALLLAAQLAFSVYTYRTELARRGRAPMELAAWCERLAKSDAELKAKLDAEGAMLYRTWKNDIDQIAAATDKAILRHQLERIEWRIENPPPPVR